MRSMHRDYSAYTQGEQIRIELYADRLVIENPGGIYGGRNRDDIWNGRSLSRNGTLARLLPLVRIPGSETTVSENLGTGLQTMLHGMREMGLDAPIISFNPATIQCHASPIRAYDRQQCSRLDPANRGRRSYQLTTKEFLHSVIPAASSFGQQYPPTIWP